MREEKSHFPGSEGIWIFVFIDMMVFLLIFITFMGERIKNIGLYTESQLHLNELFGLANTLILLTSSWMVVEGVQAARQGKEKLVSLYLSLAILFGFVFSVDKIIEYSIKFGEGINPVTNQFYTFYFFITLVHFLHVVAGIGFIFYFKSKARQCALDGKHSYVRGLENVGLFWHYVDILWIFIFPMLYLVGR